MDSEQDSFIQLPSPGASEGGSAEETPERMRQEIERCKELCGALEQNCTELHLATETIKQQTQELWREVHKLLHINLEQMSLGRDGDKPRQVEMFLAKEENTRLRQEKQVLEKKLEGKRKSVSCEGLAMVLPALPDKKMVFKGLVTNKEDSNKLTLTPQIHYPLLGGSALITFEKAEVAQRIIKVKEHMVELSCGEEVEELDQCRMRVQAAPVDVLLPSALEIGLERSSRSILVSGLPSLSIPEEALLDKVELFFSKKKNGGGEVEDRQFLDDTGQVVLVFVQDGVAELFIEKGHAQVPIGKGKYNLKISPCMSGDITGLQLQPSCCPRTILLSGIPDVLGEEAMRDTLEIHFQKTSRGGGEVEAIAYVPAGQRGLAVFTEDTG